MTIENVFVLGAPADQGIPLVTRLLDAGYQVTAGVRRADALADSPFPDLPWKMADITDAASLEAAFAGQDALAMHLPFEFDREVAASFGRNIAQAAKATGLKKIVFNTSCFVADRDLDLSAHDGRRDIERSLEETGITCVFIEPVVFMNNMIRVWSKPSIVNRGIFAYSAAPDLKISWVCLDDVAAYMVAALGTDAADGKHVPVGGPEALVGDEVAERLSEATGKPIKFVSITPDEFAARMSELVTGSREVEPHSIYDGMAKFYRFYNEQPESPLIVDPAETRKLLDVEPTPMRDWLRRWDWTQPT
ncbi:SDR family oxidoreductase [Tsuneonella mangrovi]|uniref:SDR family oxidoreductase n=1 Tax=Tsuneonella mangrovi TaxID=1982042 RepID=UPI000BA207BC|nr:NmrA family NAD(P)-binding protein [Tsuneonella mangrovi]